MNKKILFERCKVMLVHDIALGEWLDRTQSGQRFWRCCPFHYEMTPSLYFSPDGGGYCGCNAGGDAGAFFVRHRCIKPIEAARTIDKKSETKTVPPPTERNRKNGQQEEVEHWHKYNRLYDIIHTTRAVRIRREAELSEWKALENDQEFWQALEAYVAAQTMLNNINERYETIK